jgi:flagellar basal body-associated protein FliL
MAKPSPTPRDNFLLYTVGGALTLVFVGFVLGWLYFERNASLQPQVAYVSFGPLVVRASTYSIRTSLAVQTSSAQESWIEDNKQRLQYAVEAALSNIDEQRVRQPDGVAYLQDTLRDRLNHDLSTGNVQDVLLTDFIIQSN